jgi:hypothetical protein
MPYSAIDFAALLRYVVRNQFLQSVLSARNPRTFMPGIIRSERDDFHTVKDFLPYRLFFLPYLATFKRRIANHLEPTGGNAFSILSRNAH